MMIDLHVKFVAVLQYGNSVPTLGVRIVDSEDKEHIFIFDGHYDRNCARPISKNDKYRLIDGYEFGDYYLSKKHFEDTTHLDWITWDGDETSTDLTKYDYVPAMPMDHVIPSNDHEMRVIAMIAGDIKPQFGAWFNAVVEILQGKSLVTRGTNWNLTKHGEAFYASFQKQSVGAPYQERVVDWFEHTFGMAFSDVLERLFRFGEESIELMQAGGVNRGDTHTLVDHVYDRPMGEVKQEIGGVITTLMILCKVLQIDFNDAAETELRNIWGRVEKIRFKQANKPHASPLPGKSEEELANG